MPSSKLDMSYSIPCLSMSMSNAEDGLFSLLVVILFKSCQSVH